MKTSHDILLPLAFVDNRRDPFPVPYELKWQAIINILSQPEVREEKDGPGFVPAELGHRDYKRKDGTEYTAIMRRKGAVERISMAVADYDDGVTPKQAAKHFREYEHVIYSTHSHRKGKPKFRVVLLLAEPVAADCWNSAWPHFRDMATIGQHTIDLACSDACRLYYLPSHPPGVKPVFRYHSGKLLTLPTWEHPEAAPQLVPSWRTMHRNDGIGNITLPDWLDSKGISYREKSGDSDVFQLSECPWSDEHASGKDGWGHAAVLVRDGKWGFSCCHATCKQRGRGWSDFREMVSPKPMNRGGHKLNDRIRGAGIRTGIHSSWRGPP